MKIGADERLEGHVVVAVEITLVENVDVVTGEAAVVTIIHVVNGDDVNDDADAGMVDDEETGGGLNRTEAR